MKKYIIIIGYGSYVLNDKYGNGVVLRSILQWNSFHANNQFEIILFYRNEEKKKYIQDKLKEIKNSNKVILKNIKELDKIIKNENIFASFVSVPDINHFGYIEKFLSYNIATWVVKPLTDNLEQALLLKKMPNSNLLWIDYHKRFDQSNMLAKKIIDTNQYGKLLNYSVEYTQPYDLPLETFAWAKNTNVFSYIGCHYVDQLEFLYGKKIESFYISSLGTKGKVFRTLGANCYDTIVSNMDILLGNKDNIICNFHIGWNDPKGTPSKSHQRVELTFENARIILDQKERGIEIWDDDKLHYINPYFFIENYDTFYNDIIYSGYGYDSIKYFLEFCKTKSNIDNNSLPFLKNVLFSEYVLNASKISLNNNGKQIFVDMRKDGEK